MHPAPVLDIEGIVMSREHDHLVGVEDGRTVSSSQHPEYSISEKRGRSVPWLGHGGTQLPGVGLHPPPVAGCSHFVILCPMLVTNNLRLGSYKSFKEQIRNQG